MICLRRFIRTPAITKRLTAKKYTNSTKRTLLFWKRIRCFIFRFSFVRLRYVSVGTLRKTRFADLTVSSYSSEVSSTSVAAVSSKAFSSSLSRSISSSFSLSVIPFTASSISCIASTSNGFLLSSIPFCSAH